MHMCACVCLLAYRLHVWCMCATQTKRQLTANEKSCWPNDINLVKFLAQKNIAKKPVLTLLTFFDFILFFFLLTRLAF
jgi:hypothetical protein